MLEDPISRYFFTESVIFHICMFFDSSRGIMIYTLISVEVYLENNISSWIYLIFSVTQVG